MLRFSDLKIKHDIRVVYENIKKVIRTERKYFEIAQQRIENKIAKGNISESEEDE